MYLFFCHNEVLFLVIKTKTMATQKYTNINVIEYLTIGDLSDLSELSEDEDNIDVMINEQATSQQFDTAGSEDKEKMQLAAHATSKPDVAACSEDEDEMPVALLQSTNDPTSSTSSKKTNKKRIFRRRTQDLPTSSSCIFWQSIELIRRTRDTSSIFFNVFYRCVNS